MLVLPLILTPFDFRSHPMFPSGVRINPFEREGRGDKYKDPVICVVLYPSKLLLLVHY